MSCRDKKRREREKKDKKDNLSLLSSKSQLYITKYLLLLLLILTIITKKNSKKIKEREKGQRSLQRHGNECKKISLKHELVILRQKSPLVHSEISPTPLSQPGLIPCWNTVF